MSLTKAALWSSEPSTEGFPLDQNEWVQLYFMSRKQTVEGIIYDVICQLPEDMLPPEDILIQWMKEVQMIEAKHQLHVRTLAWLTGRLENETSLKPIILKGLPLASLYPIPSHRISGDIDIFYGSEADCSRANSQVESWGFPVSHSIYGECAFIIGEVPIEHHSLVSISHVPWRNKSLKSWAEHESSLPTGTMAVDVAGMKTRVLSPLLDMVQLASHSLKHALNEGIGLRQMCDMALYVEKYHDKMEPQELRKTLKRFGLKRWTDICLAYCTVYLGLPKTCLPYNPHYSKKQLNAMHKEIMLSGNFGMLDERNTVKSPSGSTQEQTAKRILRNIWRYITLSPMEAISWLIELSSTRTKEKIKK